MKKRAVGMNKKGAEMSVNTIIIIILAILVLVFVIVGFTIGWNKILPFIQSSNNIKEIADKCTFACTTQAVYDYCVAQRDVVLENEVSLTASDGSPVKIPKSFKATCNEIVLVPNVGFGSCADIQCDNFVYSLDFAKLYCGKMGKKLAQNGVDTDVKIKVLNPQGTPPEENWFCVA